MPPPLAWQYEDHYDAAHKHACAECHRSFPNDRLLDLHITERHDPFFQVLPPPSRVVACRVIRHLKSNGLPLSHGLSFHASKPHGPFFTTLPRSHVHTHTAAGPLGAPAHVRVPGGGLRGHVQDGARAAPPPDRQAPLPA